MRCCWWGASWALSAMADGGGNIHHQKLGVYGGPTSPTKGAPLRTGASFKNRVSPRNDVAAHVADC